jgi:hypoxanthine phosphoribosyltransferase
MSRKGCGHLKIVTWPEYTELLKKLHEEIEMREFDSVVGVSRGGSIIAAYLASKMGVPRFYSLFIRHVGRGEAMEIRATDLEQAKYLEGRVLLVDDWLCEGRAIRFILDNIPKKTTVTTLIMYCRTGADFKPDYVGSYVEEKEREITFPYDPIG